MTRGPVILGLEILSVITALLAIASFLYAISAFDSRLDGIQHARQVAAHDSCQILRGLILTSGRLTGREHRALVFLRRVGLGDCRAYAVKVRTGQHIGG